MRKKNSSKTFRVIDASDVFIKQEDTAPLELTEKNDDPIKIFLEKLCDINISNNALKEELFGIYNDTEFRHSYSDVTMYLFNITGTDYSQLDTMVSRIKVIIEEMPNSEAKKRIFKLYDHLNLELVRLKYLLPKIQDTNEKMQEAANKVKDLTDQTKNIKKNADDMQKHYITILGIFASIVLAFVSSLAFSTSVLQNIDKVSIYRLIAVISLIAIFVVNILNFLFSFIKQIHYGKDDESSKFKPLNLFNIIMLLIIFLTTVAWYFYHPYEHKTTTSNTTTININASDLTNCQAK
jgi:hypothetical protein